MSASCLNGETLAGDIMWIQTGKSGETVKGTGWLISVFWSLCLDGTSPTDRPDRRSRMLGLLVIGDTDSIFSLRDKKMDEQLQASEPPRLGKDWRHAAIAGTTLSRWSTGIEIYLKWMSGKCDSWSQACHYNINIWGFLKCLSLNIWYIHYII